MRIDPGGGGRLLLDPSIGGWHSDPPPEGWKYDLTIGSHKVDPGGGRY
ncbi:hypothetical protein HRF87_21660 [Bacillus sp. CRN 9]|nr:hypothetical protein [Bacillus sp. CRN 9]